MLHVLYFTTNFGTGGAERLVFDLARMLDRSRFRASICVFTSGPLQKDLDADIGFHVIGADSGKRSSFTDKLSNAAAIVGRLNAVISEHEVDVLHTHYLGPLFYSLLASQRRKRKTAWVHTEHIPLDLEAYDRRMLFLMKPFLRAPHRLTGVSKAVSEYFVARCGIPEQRVSTILNGVNVRAFSSPGGSADAKRREIGIPPDAKVVGVMANLRPQKNHRLLLNAYPAVAASVPDLHMVFCGDGECRSDLERLARGLGIGERVHFLGRRLDAPELMSTFDVYCLPSLYEGMPLSIMEAWAGGKPVVAAHAPGIRELVEDGVNGLLVPSDDPAKLAEGLLTVLHNRELRETITSNGREFALKNCSAEIMIGTYESLYAELSGGAL